MATTTITIRNVLSTTIGAYIDYADKIVALVFRAPDGIVSVNGEAWASIPETSDGNLALDGTRVELETENTYGHEVGTWDIDSTYLAKFSPDAGTTWYIVVFGYISANGTILGTIGTAGDDIVLEVDDNNVPTILYDVRLDGLPSRSDCDVVQTTWSQVSYNLGELPIQ